MNTTTPARAQVVADYDGDPFVVTVTHVGRWHDGVTGATRNEWRWQIRSASDAADWQPVRMWSGTDLSSASPDPVAALAALGSFLSSYSHAWLRGEEGDDDRDLFPADLLYDLAYDLSYEIEEAQKDPARLA